MAAALGVVVALALAACAPNQGSSSPAGSTGDPAAAVAWSIDVDCGTCHIAEQASYGQPDCLAGKHADSSCLSCHVDAAALEGIHDNKASTDKMPSRLKKTEVLDATCLACHYGTKEALAANTPGVKVTDENGTAVNPHDLPATDEHGRIVCGNCHVPHEAAPTQTQAETKCTTCHHQNVYECHTCHD